MMPATTKLVAILKPVEFVGFIIQPYLYTEDNFLYITPEERITHLNFSSESNLPVGTEEIYILSSRLEPSYLINQFSKKKMSPKDFFGQKGNLIEEVVKPFIDQNLSGIIDTLRRHNIPLYDANGLPHLYETDRINIVNEKAATLLKFDRTEEGTVYMLETSVGKHKINLQDPSAFILTNQPCHIIFNKRLISFDKSINGKLLSPFLLKDFISIPKRLENNYFNTFIKKIVTNSEIKITGFKVNDVQIMPEAKLYLDIDWQGRHCVVMKFLYGEKAILPRNTQKHFTDLTSDKSGFTFYRSKRDHAFESAKKEILTSTGLVEFENIFSLKAASKENNQYQLIEWLTNNHDFLKESGFHISQETSEKYCLCVPEIQHKLISDNDWFDLHILIRVNNFEISFSQLKNHILNYKREYILPDGYIFLIPDPWFEQYRDILIHAVATDGYLKLNKHHYKLLVNYDFEEIAGYEDLNTVLSTSIPDLRNVTLRPYQITGLNWMSKLKEMGFGGILADDMGLGKTLQTIAMLASFYPPDFTSETSPDHFYSSKKASKESDSKDKPCSIIVMPASLIHNWVSEINRFAPYLKVFVYTGTARKQSKNLFKKYQILLTTYGTLRNDIRFLSDYRFAHIILDESQQIKNPSSKTAQAIFELKGFYRFALTGTPVENSLTDLWSQMNFANPGLMGNASDFNTYYSVPLSKDPEGVQSTHLLSMIEPFILRRTKESVAPELPALTETITYCTMSEEQSTLYESEKSKVRNLVFDQLEKGNIASTPVMLLKALMQLRQIANHPRMVDSQSEVESGKFEEVKEKLDTIISENHTVLVFSSFVKHLKLFEDYCLEKGYKFSLLTGSTQNRAKVISEFKNNDDTKIFLISLKAGGVGLNLTEADYVFILDPWWNPAAELQAVNRSHRIGQNNNVFVYRFITKDTVEEKILTLQLRKKALADAFIKPRQAISGMSREEILQLFE